MTFSLLGRCERSGMLGGAIASSSPAVGARCLEVRAAIGAVASQNITDPRLRGRMLAELGAGASASEAVGSTAGAARCAEHRQLLAIDPHGCTGAFTGALALGRHGHRFGRNCVAAGNLLHSQDVLDAMIAGFERDPHEHLGTRLIAALAAAVEAGGEAGPIHAAALLIADEVAWPVADLRVDWDEDPAGELERLWTLWRPQLTDYVTRALSPAAAPGYGVPGEHVGSPR